jgi:hypothetical protein
MDRMPDVNVALLILAKPMCVSPYQPFRGNEPVMDAFVRMRSGTDNWEPSAGLIRCLKVEP